jgi:hypothetical protein
MFQSVMNPSERRNLGAHYTSEKNILKLIKPLFLDDLWSDFEKIKGDTRALSEFHVKIANLRFLDPACGCGNFLIITYRELRLLELEVILELQRCNVRIHQMEFIDISLLFKVNVDKFYGIEYEEFPAQIAQVAMWMIDHQMNLNAGLATGKRLVRIPLVKSAKIIQGNALQINWNNLLNEEQIIEIHADEADIIVNSVVKEPVVKYGKVKLVVDKYKVVDFFEAQDTSKQFNYILGNPPFIGSKLMKQNQRDDITELFNNIQGSGILDYVTGWYIKAAKLIQNTNTKVAFVSTNSIVQGEQTSILWSQMLSKYNIKIHFAHRTFKWSNEAKGNAAVFCVIIGFANFDSSNKTIFEYDDIKSEPHEIRVKNINPYLVDAIDIIISNRTKPICNVPEMIAGNVSYDYGFYIFTLDEMNDFIKKEPEAKKWFRKLIGGRELINNEIRYCLWLKDIQLNELKSMKYVLEKVDKVKKGRLAAKDKGTHRLAERSHQFRDLNNPEKYIAIPKTSSENRKYIPMAYLDKEYIPSDSIRVIENGTLFHFGILTSEMHMSWVRNICGRLKSDFRYSKDTVYNNYPWPENPTDKQILKIETAAQKVLDARTQYTTSSLADMYHPLLMPPALVKAHNELDKAVDLAYRSQPFSTEAKRMEFLFELYEKYTADLFTKEKVKKTKKTK